MAAPQYSAEHGASIARRDAQAQRAAAAAVPAHEMMADEIFFWAPPGGERFRRAAAQGGAYRARVLAALALNPRVQQRNSSRLALPYV